MKRINKLFGSFLLISFFFGNLYAANLNELQTAKLAAIQVGEHNDYNDGTLLKVWYVGAATQSVVEVSSEAFNTYAPIGTADLALVTNLAAYDTLGELCDYIEKQDDYNCDLTGGKRDDDSSLLDFVTAASGTDCKPKAGYAVTIDTAGITETDPYIMRLGITPQVDKRVILKQCRVQNDGVGTLTVYGKLAKFEGANDGVTRNDNTLVWTEITANDVTEYVPDEAMENGWLEFAKNAHVVISAGNSTEPQTATSYIECFWEER